MFRIFSKHSPHLYRNVAASDHQEFPASAAVLVCCVCSGPVGVSLSCRNLQQYLHTCFSQGLLNSSFILHNFFPLSSLQCILGFIMYIIMLPIFMLPTLPTNALYSFCCCNAILIWHHNNSTSVMNNTLGFKVFSTYYICPPLFSLSRFIFGAVDCPAECC